MKETNTQTEDRAFIEKLRKLGEKHFGNSLYKQLSYQHELQALIASQKAQWQIEARKLEANHRADDAINRLFRLDRKYAEDLINAWYYDYLMLTQAKQPSIEKHGSCCACQDCGALYEDCKCEEPSIEKEHDESA
jgi:hypothetical protein